MKFRKSLSIILVYVFIFTLLPVSFMVEKVHALENYLKYDKESTRITNKYNIKEDILKVEQYSDYTLALTKEALYFIESGQAKKYDLGKIKIFSDTSIKRNGNYIYLTPYGKNNYYKLLTIDKEKLQGTSNFISEYIHYDDYMYNPLLQEITIGDDGSKWFSLYKRYEGTYELLKVSNVKNSEAKIIGTIKSQNNLSYTDAFKNIKFDSNENIWFKVTERNGEAKKYMLGRISKEGIQNNLVFGDIIIDYELAGDGSIWIVHKDKVVHAKADGQVLKEYKGTYFKDICKDTLGDIWVLDNNKVLQLVKDEFKVAYEVKNESKELSVIDKNNITIKNIKGITRIAKGQREEIVVDSYVNNSAIVLKDSLSDVRILSDSYRYEEEDKYRDDVVTEAILKGGNFELKNKVQTKFKSYYNSTVFKDEVYFAEGKSIYVLRNNSAEEYVKLFTEEDYYDYYTSMLADDTGNMYVIGSERIYVVDKNKKVQTIDLSNINGQSYGYESKLLKDKNGDVYLISKTWQKVKINKLTGTQYRAINYRDTNGNEPLNVFLNEDNELEFVYNDYAKGYKVYKLDKNLLPVEDARLNNQGDNLTNSYYDIKGMYKTGDEKLILWIGNNMLYVKDKEESIFRASYDIAASEFISSIVMGNDGKVYIGTYGGGVISYGESSKDKEGSTSTISEDYEDTVPTEIKEEVSENKEWVIKFNQELDKTTVNEESIIVINSSGEKQDMKVLLNSDNITIKLTPRKKYIKGESYYIILKENIKSLSGKKLSKPMLVKFVVAYDDKLNEDNSEVISELDKIKFEIEIPTVLGTRDKSFIDYVVNEWKNTLEKEAEVGKKVLKVGKASILEVSVGTSTAYISFNAEIHSVTDKGVVKEVRNIDLNYKKLDGIWQAIK